MAMLRGEADAGMASRNDTHSENIKSVSGYDSTFEGLTTIIRRLTSFRSPTRARRTNFCSILAFREFLYERRLVDDRQIEKDQYSTRNSINNRKDRRENITEDIIAIGSVYWTRIVSQT